MIRASSGRGLGGDEGRTHRVNTSATLSDWAGYNGGRRSRAKSSTSTSRLNGGDAVPSRRRKTPAGVDPKASKGFKWSLRMKKVVFFLVSELILLALVAVTLVLLDNALLELYRDSAKSQLGLVDVTYKLKINQMGLGYYGNSLNGYLKDYLQLSETAQTDRESFLYGRVFNVLESELRSRQIEYSLLTDANGRIVATGNAERQDHFNETRRGEIFNPGSLMDRVLENRDVVGYQLKATVLLHRSEIALERPPTWRERPQAYLPSGDYHWTDVDHDCVVRFTFTNIHADSADGGAFLGVVVSGDVLNGKIPVAYTVVNVLDKQAGFVGVYNEDPEDGWVKSSLFYRSYSDYIREGGFVLDSATADPVTSGFLGRTLSAGHMRTDSQPGFVLAASRVPVATEQANTNAPAVEADLENVPHAVMVRGIDLNAFTTFEDVLQLTMITVGIVLFLDLVMVLLALHYLIKPLEHMAYALKNGVRLAESDIRKLQVGPFWAFLIVLSALPAVICIILVIVSNNEAINSAMRSTAEAQAGATIIAFKTKIDQMSFGFVGAANQEAVHAALLTPGDASAVAGADGIMAAEINKRRIEFAMVVDMDGTVVVSPNADRRGETFDPHGIVTATAATQERQKWTTRLSYEELMDESPPVWEESLEDGLDTMLHPTETELSTIVRYTTTLVDADADGKPDGILVSGDIVSGKTTIPETILNVNDVGYEAVYMRDVDGFWILCASAERYERGDATAVDHEFPYYGLLDDALEEGGAVSRFGTLRGKSYVFAASPLDYSVSVTDTGEELPVNRETVVVFVHGNPTTDGDGIKREQTIISVFILVVQIITSGIMIWIAFDPMRKMISVLRSYGFSQQQDGWLGIIAACDFSAARAYRREKARDAGDLEPLEKPLVSGPSVLYGQMERMGSRSARRSTEVTDTDVAEIEAEEESRGFAPRREGEERATRTGPTLGAPSAAADGDVGESQV